MVHLRELSRAESETDGVSGDRDMSFMSGIMDVESASDYDALGWDGMQRCKVSATPNQEIHYRREQINKSIQQDVLRRLHICFPKSRIDE